MKINRQFIYGVVLGLVLSIPYSAYVRGHVVEYAMKDITANDTQKAKLIKAVNPDFLTAMTQGSK